MRSEIVVGQQTGSGSGEPSPVQLHHHHVHIQDPCIRPPAGLMMIPQPPPLIPTTPPPNPIPQQQQQQFREPELDIGILANIKIRPVSDRESSAPATRLYLPKFKHVERAHFQGQSPILIHCFLFLLFKFRI